MKKTIISIALIIMACSISSAQEVDMMIYNRDVNGVDIGDVLEYDQVVSVFGEPECFKQDDNGIEGINQQYSYGCNTLDFKDDVFIGFCLRDASFTALTNHIDGGIKVGDKLSRLDNFKYGKPKFHKGNTYLMFTGSDNPVYLIVENGIIIGIDYSDPV